MRVRLATRVPSLCVSQALALSLVLLVGCDTPDRQDTKSVEHDAKESRSGRPPNVLVIVADDLGYSDLGSFGSEIDTPNLDRLAYEGVRFTDFHTSPMCSTTRAMLLTGVDHHITGFGNFADSIAENQKGKPGYEGYLNDRVVTIARVLANVGYHTSIAGKWHLGDEVQHGPAMRGFERSFALMGPGANHFNDKPFHPEYPVVYLENGHPAALPEDFYSSYFFADKTQQYITEAVQQDRPFFAILSFTAPHAPIQAPSDRVAKYLGYYDSGYTALLESRMERMADLGITQGAPQTLAAVPGLEFWDSLSPAEARQRARTMEVYAAMIDAMDQGVGLVVDHLEALRELENTVIIFFSDNGANGVEPMKTAHHLDWASLEIDNSYENLGSEISNLFIGPGWAHAITAPFRLFKGFPAEGGTRTAAFVWGPSVIGEARISHALVTVMDLFPTILDLARLPASELAYGGNGDPRPQGNSLLGLLKGETDIVHADEKTIGWELYGYRAARQGSWKALNMPVPYGNGTWQLYDLGNDPAESDDLAERRAGKLQQLIAAWDRYAKDNGVVLPEE